MVRFPNPPMRNSSPVLQIAYGWRNRKKRWLWTGENVHERLIIPKKMILVF
jgi:SLT domain-containing protein